MSDEEIRPEQVEMEAARAGLLKRPTRHLIEQRVHECRLTIRKNEAKMAELLDEAKFRSDVIASQREQIRRLTATLDALIAIEAAELMPASSPKDHEEAQRIRNGGPR